MHTSLSKKSNVIEKLLHTAQDDTGLTEQNIIYSQLVSSFEADQYLSTLLRNELIRYDRKARAYKITEQGLDLLESMTRISELDEMG